MTFDVAYNSLIGTLATTFDSFGAVQALNISHNNLTGDSLSPLQCGGFPQLQYLRVSHNNFTVLSAGELIASRSFNTRVYDPHQSLLVKQAWFWDSTLPLLLVASSGVDEIPHDMDLVSSRDTIAALQHTIISAS